MSKRTLVLVSLATLVGIVLLLVLPSDGPQHSDTQQKAVVPPFTQTATDTLDWNRILSERPNRESLNTLGERLLAMPATKAVAQIEAFLQTGKDANSEMAFEIGSDGIVSGWPTLRVFLLDILLKIDPVAAASIGRGVLAGPTTADEWALGLRNVARGESDDANRDFLRSKTEELISNPDWRAKPSIGYLNSFDVLVHTRAIESSPLLSGLIQDKDRKDLVHAAFLTLDRLVQREPIAMLERLSNDVALQKNRPEMTAQQFARADLRDLKQRELVKTWLLDPSRSQVELKSFAATFPNNNRMVSNNLLTTEPSLAGIDLAAHDREVLSVIKEWKMDTSFKPVAAHLETMDAKLSEFVKGQSH